MKPIDAFAGLNTVLFLLLAIFRYYSRFIAYRGSEHLEEFFIYAAVILGFIVALWLVFRRYQFDTTLLAIVQLGIVMHFMGAFVQVNGGRLYDAHLIGIRFDKYVHFVNAFGASLLISRLFRIQQIPLTPVNRVFVLLVVLGLGGIVEIVEYLVLLTVPNNGVGGYDNNMQDLIANLCGSLSFLILGVAAGVRRPIRA
jgi:putative membrane protein